MANLEEKIQGNLQDILTKQGQAAREAARFLAIAPTDLKNKALLHMANKLEEKKAEIIESNLKDMEQGVAGGLSEALLDRLALNENRIKAMADGLRQIVALPDPIGEVISMSKRPNGLDVGQIRTPIGVIGLIYESRPNVTADAAGLCLKAGNAIILRGGEEALNSNRKIAAVIADAAEECGIPRGAIQLVDSFDKEAAIMMMKMHDYLDVLIPRGGKGLKKAVQENATVPIIMTGMGNCHVYVDEFADFGKAIRIVHNAKVQRPSVCNAIETLLVHKNISEKFLPLVVEDLQEAKVEVKGCTKCREIVSGIYQATEEDWDTEYLDLTIAVKVVDSLDEAIDHINRHGTGHSEAI
ncbi:MAG: glutamate-5-semialdehyde dehydrogenase, partial [Syntrophomonas sp.]